MFILRKLFGENYSRARHPSAPAYINESLVHWTGRAKSDEQAFTILKTICEEQILRLTYCPNYVQKEFTRRTAMVCFTDIPLRFSHFHCKRFGRFAIAFHKQKMIEQGANPVFYTTATHFERIKRLASLLDHMRDLEKDREWKEEIEPYHFTENDTVALLEILGFLQEYSYQNDDPADSQTYNQREWRLTFDSLPFAGGSTPHTPGMSCIYIQDGVTYPILKFANANVSYILVTRAFRRKGAQVARSIGCDMKIYEDEVDV